MHNLNAGKPNLKKKITIFISIQGFDFWEVHHDNFSVESPRCYLGYMIRKVLMMLRLSEFLHWILKG